MCERALPAKASLLLAVLLAAATSPARADGIAFGPPLGPARNLVLYPALYLDLTAERLPNERAYGADGEKRDAYLPSYGDDSALPEVRERARLTWFFPFFEAAKIPFVSSRLWTARAELGLSQLKGEGGIADFVRANDLAEPEGGVRDLVLEFGPVLAGSADWRRRVGAPYALTLLGRVQAPVGARDADAPANAGSNVLGAGLSLLGSWRPHPRVSFDADASFDTYGNDGEPAFGGQFPTKPGDRIAGSVSISARLLPRVYLSLAADGWQRESNTYENVRFASTMPDPGPGMDAFADPSAAQDGGARQTRAGAALTWFVGPRTKIGVQVWQPLSGESGEFDLIFRRQLQRCGVSETPLTPPVACMPMQYASVRVDGLGPARSGSDTTVGLSLSYQFKQGDFFLGP